MSDHVRKAQDVLGCRANVTGTNLIKALTGEILRLRHENAGLMALRASTQMPALTPTERERRLRAQVEACEKVIGSLGNLLTFEFEQKRKER